MLGPLLLDLGNGLLFEGLQGPPGGVCLASLNCSLTPAPSPPITPAPEGSEESFLGGHINLCHYS